LPHKLKMIRYWMIDHASHLNSSRYLPKLIFEFLLSTAPRIFRNLLSKCQPQVGILLYRRSARWVLVSYIKDAGDIIIILVSLIG